VTATTPGRAPCGAALGEETTAGCLLACRVAGAVEFCAAAPPPHAASNATSGAPDTAIRASRDERGAPDVMANLEIAGIRSPVKRDKVGQPLRQDSKMTIIEIPDVA
jgi:hypothetical protein